MANVTSPKGTHDLIGKEAIAYNYIESVCQEVAVTYGFLPIKTPIFEAYELFSRGVGDATDIVRKEMYVFKDKGDRTLALRPEGTAGVIRSIISNKLYANSDLPLKFSYAGPMFRYERPQLGRYRQFHQFGVEAVGVSGVYDDIEVMLLASSILDALGFEGVNLKINSLSSKATRETYKKALKQYYEGHLGEVCEDCLVRYEQNPLRMLDCKVPSDVLLAHKAPKISDFLTDQDRIDLDLALEVLESMGVKTTIDYSLVRGLDYYSGLIFEFSYIPSSQKDYGAIGGGGRYDRLVSELGGPELEGVGFAFGIERLYSILNEEGKLDQLDNSEDIYVMSVGEKSRFDAFFLLSSFRAYGIKGVMNFTDKSFKSLFKLASNRGAKFALIIGPDEAEKEVVNVKNLETQEQITLPYAEVVKKVINMLGYHLHEHDHDHEGECSCGHDHHHHDEEDHECACGHHHSEDENHECACHHGDKEHECECGHKHEAEEE